MKNANISTIKKDIKIKPLLLSFSCFLALLYSCEQKGSERVTLMLNQSESIIEDSRFVFDSITFVYSRDTIWKYRYWPRRFFENPTIKIDDKFCEVINIRSYIDNTITRKDTMMMFTLRDTSYVYKIKNKSIATVLDLAYADCIFYFKKDESGNRMTLKQSLIESTYKEIYYYDENYRVFKYVNTYKGNVCIYERPTP